MVFTDIITFLGRFHPLIVHLPIGFLLMAAVFNVLSYFPNYRFLKDAMSFTLLAGFLSAVAACMLGYLLSQSGEYDPEVLSQHRLSGILLAILAGILWSMTTRFYAGFMMISRKIVTALCILLVLLTAYTGHQGGTLTHGSDYLSLETLTYQAREKPAKAEDALVFEDVILPMLERRCQGCHQKGKRKGRLIVGSYAQLMKGGKHGPVLEPGKPEESELYRRITLDPGDEDFMPTDGKTPLTKLETEMIRWWIENANASEASNKMRMGESVRRVQASRPRRGTVGERESVDSEYWKRRWFGEVFPRAQGPWRDRLVGLWRPCRRNRALGSVSCPHVVRL